MAYKIIEECKKLKHKSVRSYPNYSFLGGFRGFPEVFLKSSSSLTYVVVPVIDLTRYYAWDL